MHATFVRTFLFILHNRIKLFIRIIFALDTAPTAVLYFSFARGSGGEVLWWVRLCVSVCLCVCLTASVSPEPHVRSLPLCMHVAYRRGSVLLHLGDEIPRGRGNFGDFSHWQWTAQHSIWDQYKNGWTNLDAVWDDDSGGPWVSCVRWMTPSQKGKGQLLEENIPAHCKVTGQSMVSCAKKAEPIEMPFPMNTRVAPRNYVLDGSADPPRERRNFRGLSGPFKSTGNPRCSGRFGVAEAFAAKGIIQSPITSCRRRDHSVCQASANSTVKKCGRRRCGISTAKGVVRLHSAGEVWYLRLPCFVIALPLSVSLIDDVH